MVDQALRHTHNALALQPLENHLVYLVLDDRFHIPQDRTVGQTLGYL